MWQNVNVLRTTRELEDTVEALRALREQGLTQASIENNRLRWNNELRDYLELEAMVAVAECVAHSALARHESRGAHYVGDYPDQDDINWLKNTVTTKSDATVVTSPGNVARLDAQSSRC
jgi:succinate dehydrogenase/fumarate reductase flavoprotein subunit